MVEEKCEFEGTSLLATWVGDSESESTFSGLLTLRLPWECRGAVKWSTHFPDYPSGGHLCS